MCGVSADDEFAVRFVGMDGAETIQSLKTSWLRSWRARAPGMVGS